MVLEKHYFFFFFLYAIRCTLKLIWTEKKHCIQFNRHTKWISTKQKKKTLKFNLYTVHEIWPNGNKKKNVCISNKSSHLIVFFFSLLICPYELVSHYALCRCWSFNNNATCITINKWCSFRTDRCVVCLYFPFCWKLLDSFAVFFFVCCSFVCSLFHYFFFFFVKQSSQVKNRTKNNKIINSLREDKKTTNRLY